MIDSIHRDAQRTCEILEVVEPCVAFIERMNEHGGVVDAIALSLVYRSTSPV